MVPVIQLQKPTPLQPSANHMSKYSQCPHCGQVKSIDEFPFHVKQCKEKHLNNNITSQYGNSQFYGASSSPPPIAVPMPTSTYFSPPAKFTQTTKSGMTISSVPPKIGQNNILPHNNHHVRPVISSQQSNIPNPSPIRSIHQQNPSYQTQNSPLVSHSILNHSPIVTQERRENYYSNPPRNSFPPSPSPIVSKNYNHSPSSSSPLIPPVSKKPRTRANTVDQTVPSVEYVPPVNIDFKFRPKAWSPMPKIPDGPVFRPTEEEFKDPMKYLTSIAPTVRKYGIAKIIPPSNTWLKGKPFTKVVNPKTFIFQTKSQNIHQLQHRQGPNERFLEELEQFLKERGAPIRTIPTIDGRELDLYKLYCSVMSRGGLQQVIRLKKWPEIIRELHISSDCTSASTLLKRNYYRFLWNYELSQTLKSGNNNMTELELKTIEKEAAKWANDDSISDKKMEQDEFGYGDGRIFTLSSFKKFANTFKKKWFDMDEEIPSEEIENAYWRILENCEDSVEVHYGSDLEVSSHGSGFANTPDDLKNASGWNLNIFAKMPGSLLSFLHENIGGVTIPMMYMGMLFSTFCWHTEDNFLYSINYLHHGASKSWYGIPGYAADDFEKVMKKTVPELFETQPDLLHLLITMLSPRILMENNVPIYHFIQEAGEFVITLPRAYHAGFSHGFNCAESSNFALFDWIPFGRNCLKQYRQFSRSSVVSIDKILCNAALSSPLTPELRELLRTELPLMRKTEQFLREKVFEREGTWKAIHFDAYEGREVEMKECEICKFDCYLSAIACPCSPNKIVCLQHSNELCDCDPARKTLLFRWKLSDIDNLLKNVGIDAPLPIEDVKMNDVLEKENIQNQSSKREVIGRGHAGKKSRQEVLLHSLVGTSKPSIRKLARLEGIRKLKKAGLNYNDASCAADSYIIEKIVEKRTNEREVEYLIKWQNYPESENTWVSGNELGCPGLIDSFENGNKPITLKSQTTPKVTKSRKMARSINPRRMM